MEIRLKARNKNTGFTLVEVIISLFIFSLIASSTLYASRIGLNAGEQLKRADDELRQLQISRLLIKEDLAQILLRRVRDEFGNNEDASFLGGERANSNNFDDEEIYLLRFVRNGWSNPDFADPRSSVQYVEYLVRSNQMIRRTRPFLDHAPNQPFYERVMLDNVSDLRVEFLSSYQRGEAQWIDTWPLGAGSLGAGALGAGSLGPGSLGIPGNGAVSPAIRLTFTTERLGELSQLFWIGPIGNVEGS